MANGVQLVAFSRHFQDVLSAGGASHRLLLGLLFAALPLVAAAEKTVLQATGFWENVNTAKFAPTTHITEERKVLRLMRLSKTRYLALVKKSRFQVDSKTDPKTIEEQRRAQGFVKVPVSKFKDRLFLAFFGCPRRDHKKQYGGARGSPELESLPQLPPPPPSGRRQRPLPLRSPSPSEKGFGLF